MTKQRTIGLWIYDDEGNTENIKQIVQYFTERNYHVISGFQLNDCYIQDGQVYTPSGENLSEAELFYHMTIDSRTPFTHTALKCLELSGVKLINSFTDYENAADKAITNLLLKKAGIRTAPSILISNIDKSLPRVKAAFDDWGMALLKPRVGAGGKGIVKLDSYQAFLEFFEYTQSTISEYYLEKYIPFGDRDYRVDMINGEVIHLYSRCKGDSYKTNIHSGVRTVCAFNVDPEPIVTIAKQVVDVLNLQTSIVDIAQSTEDNEYYVIEANETLGMFLASYMNELDGVEMPDDLIDDGLKRRKLCEYLEHELKHCAPYKEYDEFYIRNDGIFSQEQQYMLRDSHVCILGTGGIGGPQAVALARLGVGKFTIMDPGMFDEPDFNRQYAAFTDTLGKNKAMSTANELKRIAPYAKVQAYDYKLSSEELEKVIATCDVVLDGIDFEDYEYKVLTNDLARKHNKYTFSCPIPDLGAVMMIFAPDGMSMREFTPDRCYPKISNYHRLQGNPINHSSDEGMGFLASKASLAPAASLCAAMMSSELGLFLAGIRKPEELKLVPEVWYIDLEQHTSEIFAPENHK